MVNIDEWVHFTLCLIFGVCFWLSESAVIILSFVSLFFFVRRHESAMTFTIIYFQTMLIFSLVRTTNFLHHYMLRHGSACNFDLCDKLYRFAWHNVRLVLT